jgi:hypothetical protein
MKMARMDRNLAGVENQETIAVEITDFIAIRS